MSILFNKLKFAVGISSTLLLLTACDSIAPEDIAEANKDITTQINEIGEINQELLEEEEKFDQLFQKVLVEDASLDSLKDESADIFTNITSRQETSSQFSEKADAISEKAEYISAYEGEELSAQMIEKSSNNFLTFSHMIQDYEKNYQESIDFQKDYLNQISLDEANYEDFSEGLQELNENYLALQESKENLESEFQGVRQSVLEIKKEIPLDEKEDDSENNDITENLLTINENSLLNFPTEYPEKFVYDSGIDIAYPEDGVKGIYATAHSAGGERMNSLVDLVNQTPLNAMVIDIKDDHGNVTIDLDSDNELINEMTNEIIDIEELMTLLDENNIYPIARIVVFKDTLLARANPDWSFTDSSGAVWENRRRESFVNPYLEEVWDYNIEVAIEAAKLGFKDIQFDYVRFPEGFENRADSLNYTHGNYVDESEDVISMEYRNRAVTEFVRKAKDSLRPYGADLSVDIFGYAALVRETPGIGQSFPGIAQEVDAISSMIYPSHWGAGNLGISKPDLEPYNVVNNYIQVEQEIFEELGDKAPISRPWLQDFTASYLGAGNYKKYGAAEVTAQIKALADNNIHEYLLWNAGNRYSEGANYKYN